jgi:histidinol dehydrogenase
MRIIDASDPRALDRLVERDAARDPRVMRQAARIVADVRARGDRAVRAWEEGVGTSFFSKLEGVGTSSFPAKTGSLSGGRWGNVGIGPKETSPDPETFGEKTSPDPFGVAVRHIAAVARRQLPQSFSIDVTPGVRIEQRVQPLARVGCYVPGGRYPLPSTLLMTAVPAKVAGVADVIVCCPRPTPAILAAARAAGVTRLFPIGGAQAIAAMAYGTETIPRVDKIVGPGGVWVAAAKIIVAPDCAIDMHAGPSEIVVYSNRGRAAWIAADLIAQAEHDPAARAICVTTRRALAAAVGREVTRQLPRSGPATRALAANGAVVYARTRRTAIDVVNRLAPEHLVVDRGEDLDAFRAAGTIFVGDWSAQASGDYATGSNHVLPTGGAARARGGLSAADFVRVFTVQTLSRRGLAAIGPAAIALAEMEGLTAHAQSIRMRLESGR